MSQKRLALRRELIRNLDSRSERLPTPQMRKIEGQAITTWVCLSIASVETISHVITGLADCEDHGGWYYISKFLKPREVPPPNTNNTNCGQATCNFCTKGYCFAEGTLVRVPGGVRRIEELEKGSRILGFDLARDTIEESEVLGLDVHEGEFELIPLSVGIEETLLVTCGHRFRTANRWQAVETLADGDRCEAISGDRLAVSGLGATRTKTGMVYNVKVAGLRNYFVSRAGLLVRDH